MTKEKKYITLEEGVDFRTIAKIMTANGFRMNHATARNQLIVAMEKLLTNIASEIQGKQKAEMINLDLDGLLKDANIHEYLSDILYLAHKEQENGQD
jgi:hypothetical protein